jgi:Z1 domain
MTPYETARNLVQLLLKGELTPSQDLIREKVEMALSMLNSQGIAREIVAEELIREIETLYSVWIPQGSILEDKDQEHVPWLYDCKSSISWDFWDRYQRYLEEEKAWAPATVNRLDQLTDEVLDRLENPERNGSWDRRGMVVGQVQSGKTSHYTGLICKAVDSGYKLIVVLSGLHKSLRSQTQMRLDEGFLGRDSQVGRAFDTGMKEIGVGLIPIGKDLKVIPGTTSADSGDFKTNIANYYNVPPSGSDPILMVVKKNKTVLNNLIRWAINWGSQDPESGKKVVRDFPLIVIDDEADNASVNTKKLSFDKDGKLNANQDATAINALIRKLLNSFEKRVYVGYTATPFANIFIHPDIDTDEHGEDLFPRHFIVNLPTPSNYVGPVQVFGLNADSAAELDQVEGLDIIKTIEDQDEWMPIGHKTTHIPKHLPKSLKDAIRAFIISCAVRIFRNQIAEHNSMLIHVTRWKSVQGLVTNLVNDELTSLKRQLRYGEGILRDQVLEEFKEVWEKDKSFPKTSQEIVGTELQPSVEIPEWEDIITLLNDAAGRIQVKKINGGAKDILDYEDYRRKGLSLNVIAIGGDKLSRGLTLEGLSVSYYLRPSKMYDTLMQMGRWFGYRPGYLDVCRLYTTKELVDWYRHITLASEELRKEFDHMEQIGADPSEFRLKVRTHPSGLIITGISKMRNGEIMKVSFAGRIGETSVFYRDDIINLNNFQATEELIADVNQHPPERKNGNYVWGKIPTRKVIDFLSRYQSHKNSRFASSENLIKYIQKQVSIGELTDWTVALISNEAAKSTPYKISGLDVGLTLRRNEEKSPPTEYRLIKSRLLSPLDELIDLPQLTIDEIFNLSTQSRKKKIEDALKKGSTRWSEEDLETTTKTPNGEIIRKKRGELFDSRKGLIILYPLDPQVIDSSIPVVGFAISFPTSERAEAIEYKVNLVDGEYEFVDEDEN